MSDHVASKSKIKFIVWPYGVGFGIGFAVVVSTVVYVILRLHAMQAWQADLQVLYGRVEALEKATAAITQTNASRLDYLERTVYGDLLSKVMQPPPAPPPVTRFETWQANREKELKARIDRLERWRLEQER